jgi:hypothetical protein
MRRRKLGGVGVNGAWCTAELEEAAVGRVRARREGGGLLQPWASGNGAARLHHEA